MDKGVVDRLEWSKVLVDEELRAGTVLAAVYSKAWMSLTVVFSVQLKITVAYAST